MHLPRIPSMLLAGLGAPLPRPMPFVQRLLTFAALLDRVPLPFVLDQRLRLPPFGSLDKKSLAQPRDPQLDRANANRQELSATDSASDLFGSGNPIGEITALSARNHQGTAPAGTFACGVPRAFEQYQLGSRRCQDRSALLLFQFPYPEQPQQRTRNRHGVTSPLPVRPGVGSFRQVSSARWRFGSKTDSPAGARAALDPLQDRNRVYRPRCGPGPPTSHTRPPSGAPALPA